MKKLIVVLIALLAMPSITLAAKGGNKPPSVDLEAAIEEIKIELCNHYELTGDPLPPLCLDFCGNGVTESFEQCDDGNLTDGDGCSSSCSDEIICGNGIQESGEECDDGNTNDGDGCSSGCVLECRDDDADGICASEDNCWTDANPVQSDSDGDCPNPPYIIDPQCGDACDPVPVDPCSSNPCSDGITCTFDICTDTGGGNYSCSYEINPSYCLIDGTCYADGASSPYDCGWCDLNNSQTTWSPKPETYACRAAINGCDVTEYCNGSTLTCPDDSFQPVGTPCGTNGETCDASGLCSQ